MSTLQNLQGLCKPKDFPLPRYLQAGHWYDHFKNQVKYLGLSNNG